MFSAGSATNVGADPSDGNNKEILRWEYKGDPPKIESVDDALKINKKDLARFVIFEAGKSNPSDLYKQIVSNKKVMGRLNTNHLNIAFNELTDYVNHVKTYNEKASVPGGEVYKSPKYLQKVALNIDKNLLQQKTMKHKINALEKKSRQLRYDMTRKKSIDPRTTRRLKLIKNPPSNAKVGLIGGLIAAGSVGGLAYMNSRSSPSSDSTINADESTNPTDETSNLIGQDNQLNSENQDKMDEPIRTESTAAI